MLFIGILLIISAGILISIFFLMKHLKNKLYFHPYKNHVLTKPSDKIEEKWILNNFSLEEEAIRKILNKKN